MGPQLESVELVMLAQTQQNGGSKEVAMAVLRHNLMMVTTLMHESLSWRRKMPSSRINFSRPRRILTRSKQAASSDIGQSVYNQGRQHAKKAHISSQQPSTSTQQRDNSWFLILSVGDVHPDEGLGPLVGMVRAKFANANFACVIPQQAKHKVKPCDDPGIDPILQEAGPITSSRRLLIWHERLSLWRG
jgi:hypothetical protein